MMVSWNVIFQGAELLWLSLMSIGVAAVLVKVFRK